MVAPPPVAGFRPRPFHRRGGRRRCTRRTRDAPGQTRLLVAHPWPACLITPSFPRRTNPRSPPSARPPDAPPDLGSQATRPQAGVTGQSDRASASTVRGRYSTVAAWESRRPCDMSLSADQPPGVPGTEHQSGHRIYTTLPLVRL